ncbi:hypothetical protein GOP47_0016769 [Adiantum capillus-veneris]|uniref:lysozyme n=1 Tax=Adiantum capillus-veneris TaxID=13818 RepID=A0A9D4ZB11_ADICA|nr:hypothetical protein GOP47_0016769 [Adiantum capillus-veneris]
MGYQLPKLGNVAFPGFGALGKQQAKDSTRSKKEKDRERHRISRSTSTPSSPSSNSFPAVAARPSCEGKLLQQGFLQKWRQELRPLLNSMRFVEASNRESSNDGASRIGPFQISRQYHQQAWKHSPPMAWSRCRDMNHAENTIIAYWLKYCPEAVERHDFEFLAKIHKDGIQGMQKEDVNCYWKKISHHLKQQETAGPKKENTTWSFFSNEKNATIKHCGTAKQDASSKLHKKATPVLSPINTNTLPPSTPPRSSCATPPKQQLPLIQTLRPKLFRRALTTEEKKAAVNGTNGGARPGSAGGEATSCKKALNKRIRRTTHCQSNHSLNPNSLGHAFNLSFCQLSHAERIMRAAILVQAQWRMRRDRKKFERMRNAAVLIQQGWRKRHCDCSCGQTIRSREDEDLDCASFNSPKTTPLCMEKQAGHVGPSGSPCELLYRSDISPNQEDELLTELVSLLNLDTESPSVVSCHSFRFPKSLDELTDACTPKMKADLRNFSMEVPSISAEQRTEEPHCPSLMCETTPRVIKQVHLSPLMENEIMAELAKLCPPSKEASQEIAPSASLSLTRSDQSFKPNDTKVNIAQEQLGKDGGIIRRLTFNSTGVERVDNAVVTNDGGLERQSAQYSMSSSSEVSINSQDYEDQLKEINIPLLVDQSPILTSKRRARHWNPLNRKIERALVSSLSNWQYSVSSDEEKEDNKALRDEPSSVNCRDSSTSKEIFLPSLSSIRVEPSEHTSLMEVVSGRKSCEKTLVPDDFHTDCLLETRDVKNSTIYAKAIFCCADFSLNDHEQGVLLEMSHPECDAARCRNLDGILVNSTRAASLQHLCRLWDVHNIDLLTRALKFKGLQTANRCQQGDPSQAKADDVTDILLEFHHLESLLKTVDEESKRRDSVLRQRDIIYTNIAGYCDVQERQHLYDKWEIHRVLTGRLKKIVYELLWIDPQRYQESAELVIQYL